MIRNKNKIIITTILSLIISFLGPASQKVQAQQQIKIGDYIQFGTYYNEPILWRVVHIDEDGDPLLFSENILTFKCFDAAGDYYSNKSSRKHSGSNEWEFSNIRQWLNSSDENINWIQNIPSKENILFDNAYDQEKGFLADGNFTEVERSAIKPVIHKAILSYADKDKRDGGNELHKYSGVISLIPDYDVIQNYDDAYYKLVEDKVFLLSVKEIKEYVYDRGWDFNRKPTQQAVDKSVYKDNRLNTILYWNYWLRTPGEFEYPYTESGVRMLSKDLPYEITWSHAYNSRVGVVPALYLDLSKIDFKVGSGSKVNPYKTEGIEIEEPTPDYPIGQYVQFGTYDDEPILWRIINIDEEGNPLLLSEKILSIKSFDAMGDYHTENGRKNFGSNAWESSNIRQWLNSSDERINWIQNPPTANNLSYSNAYDQEKGFLADGNFTQKERSFIKPVKHKVILANIDSNQRDGGDQLFKEDNYIDNAIQNYDKSYYKYVTDDVFLLSVKEIKEYVHDRGWEIKKRLTSRIVENTEGMGVTFNELNPYPYWLRTPAAIYTNSVRVVHDYNHFILSGFASLSSGVAPALYLNFSKATFGYGSGTIEDPYTITDRKQAIESIDSIYSLEIVEGISFEELKNWSHINGLLLPSEIKATLKDHSSIFIPVNWDPGTYDGELGSYTIIGRLDLKDLEHLENTYGLELRLKVDVVEKVKIEDGGRNVLFLYNNQYDHYCEPMSLEYLHSNPDIFYNAIKNSDTNLYVKLTEGVFIDSTGNLVDENLKNILDNIRLIIRWN